MADATGAVPPVEKTAEAPLKPLWRNRDYNLWWSGAAVSQLGSELTQLAYPLLILAATGSATQAGVVGTCGNIGFLIGALPAGVIADRLPRRAVIVVSAIVEMAAMATMLIAVASGHVWILQIAAVSLVQGVASSVGSGAHMPVLRRIVPEPQLKTAFARDHARDMGAQLAGPPLGGILFSAARWLPFLADVISFAAVALAALLMRTPLGPDRAAKDAPRPKLREDLTEGLRFVWRNTFLRYVMLWAAVVNSALAGLLLLYVVTLREHGASPTVIGTTSMVAAACGLAGALVTGRVINRMSGYRIVLVVSWLLVASTAGVALLARWHWLAGLSLGLVMFFVTPLNVTLMAHVMKLVPDEMTGRVMSSIGMAAQSLRWLGPIACGAAADAFAPTAPILVLAALFAGLAVLNHLVKAVRRIDDEPGAEPGAATPRVPPARRTES